MQLPRRNREGGRVDQRLRPQPLQRQARLREAHVEADKQAELSDARCCDWRDDGGTGLNAVAFSEQRPVGPEVDVEEVEFLVAVRDGAVGVDPDEGIGDAGRRGRRGGLVDADVDGEGVRAGGGLEALNEGGAGGGEAEGDGFMG